MRYLTANDRPGAHAPSWYAETAGDIPDYPALDGDTKADVCVIGGGYAGLSAALHLAEKGISVRMLEANRVGWGASGRNGGQLGSAPRADIDQYERSIGRDAARRVWDIANEANGLVRDLIARYAMDCDLTDGFVECAVSPRAMDELRQYVEHVATHYNHNKIRIVERGEQIEMMGTEAFHGGFFDGRAAHLHPLRYCLGLAQAAAQAGAQIHENTKALSVENGRVKTEHGTVTAPHILLCCNGYLDGLSARAQRRMLPINNYIIATEPLGETRAKKINRDNVAACDTRFVLNYWRMTPDHRVLWGGGETTGARFPGNIKGMVRRHMLHIYPDLSDVAITHAWGGTLAITGTRYPLFHDMGQGIRAIGGWSGSGVHMATMGGKIAADAIVGELADWNLLASVPTPQFPGGDWFRMPMLHLAMAWYRLRDRLG